MAAGDRIFMAKESTSQEILSNTKKIIEDAKASQPCRKERENHMVRCNRNSVIHGLLEQYRHIRHVPAKGQALCEC